MKKLKSIITLFLIGICIIGTVYSTLKIIEWKHNTNKNKDIKEILEESITVDEQQQKYKVDFKKLKSQNSDTVAYIKVNNTDVNYVVVKTKDNDYYLNHNFNKEYNVAGWIFADYKNNFDGNDKNIVIYGHNMHDGSMFATLKNIITSEWQNNENKQIILVTEKETIVYEIFSSYTIEPEEYYITTNFKDNDTFIEFLNKISQRSYYDYNIELNENDKILTLSTCTGTGNDRIVIHAKQISIEEN